MDAQNLLAPILSALKDTLTDLVKESIAEARIDEIVETRVESRLLGVNRVIESLSTSIGSLHSRLDEMDGGSSDVSQQTLAEMRHQVNHLQETVEELDKDLSSRIDARVEEALTEPDSGISKNVETIVEAYCDERDYVRQGDVDDEITRALERVSVSLTVR